MRRAVLDWDDFLGDRRGALERAAEQLGLTWPCWSDSAFAEIDEFVSADLRRQRASEDDLRAHPAVGDLVRETNAAMIGLVEDPTSSRTKSILDDARARFDDAIAIFEQAMFETDEERRRLQSRERDEHATQLAATRGQYAGQLVGMQNDFESQLAAMRTEFATQLSSANNEARHLAERVDEANRKLARTEDIVAYMARRYAQQRREGSRIRFRDYWRLGPRGREELGIIRSSIYFDEEYYLDMNPDVRAARMNAAVHYLLHGGREGRDPGPFFSTRQYLDQFPDVAGSGLNALTHYERHGRREKRNIPLRKDDLSREAPTPGVSSDASRGVGHGSVETCRAFL